MSSTHCPSSTLFMLISSGPDAAMAAALVNQLVEQGPIGREDNAPAPERINLADLIEEAVERFRGSSERHPSAERRKRSADQESSSGG